ncbi:hypothetical protein [Herpetosiphon geysericola]|uniref:Uncharacterized protein n=1 Tax=Herpetosiphon geysericola TaxID=70996 RepID=A0A0P6XJ54_9CHLR|nr:hypothetical protein [Herpetosiphon geysericola]KPL79971.1 hypothetical protein SE18_25620 [Herpetosiphon geysericola]
MKRLTLQQFQQLRKKVLPRRAQGGVLAVGAAFMMVIMLIGGLGWFYAQRVSQIQRAESAIRESTRTAAQMWSYTSFGSEAAFRDSAEVEARATQMLALNLASVPGLVGNPLDIARGATWIVLPRGGECNGQMLSSAALCGRVEVPIQSISLGFGDSTATITVEAASRLDVVTGSP